MFGKELYDQFCKFVEKYKLKQLYLLISIPLVFCFVKSFYELSFHDTFFHWFFLILTACILFISAILGFTFNKFKKHTCIINSILLIGCIVISRYCFYLYKPLQLPDDKLVVLITKFTPVSSAAEEDTENIPHRIEQALQKKQTEGIPLEIKRTSKQVFGSDKDSKRDCAIKIGSSREGHAHVILWGDVRKDEDELYVSPKITIINKTENVYDREMVFSNKAHNHIDFKEHIAKEMSNITSFVCGLAYYEAKKWDEAIQIFDQIPSDESQYYKGMCLYNRAFTTEHQKQELLAALKIFSSIIVFNKLDILKFKNELYLDVQHYLVRTLIDISFISEPKLALSYLYEAEKISTLVCNVLSEITRKDENNRGSNLLNLHLAYENLGIVLSRLGVMLSGDKGISYIENAIKIYSSAQTNILQNFEQSQWHAATFSNLGVAFLELGKKLSTDNWKKYLEKSIESHRNALEILQKNNLITKSEMTYYNLALALTYLGEKIGGEEGIKHLKEAEELLEKSLELNNKDEFPIHWAFIQNGLGVVFYSRSFIVKENKEDVLLKAVDKFQEALIVFDRSNFPRNWADTHHNIGMALHYLGITINSSKSADYFSEAILHFKNDLSVYEGQKNTNDYNVTLKMTANVYYNWGIALNNLGMFDNAIEKFEKATEINPQIADYYSDWGSVLLKQGKLNEAVEKFKKAIEINPQLAIAYYNWGTALNNLGMFDHAIEKFKKVTEINPQIADYHFVWGIALFNLEKYDEAIEQFKKAAEISPQDINILYYLGISYSKISWKDDAAKTFQRVLQFNPETSINNNVNKFLHDLIKK